MEDKHTEFTHTIELNLDAETRSQLDTFKQRFEHVSDAAALRQLVRLGLKLFLNDPEPHPVSNRTLLEKIFLLTVQNQPLLQQTFFNTFVDHQAPENQAFIEQNATAANRTKQDCMQQAELFCQQFLSAQKPKSS
jgi:hypothetical protein